MKAHIKQGPGSWVVVASCGAVQTKTNRKWVWAFIKAIAELIELVVSIYIIVFIYFLITRGQRVLVFITSVVATTIIISHYLPLPIIATTLISPNLRST